MKNQIIEISAHEAEAIVGGGFGDYLTAWKDGLQRKLDGALDRIGQGFADAWDTLVN